MVDLLREAGILWKIVVVLHVSKSITLNTEILHTEKELLG